MVTDDIDDPDEGDRGEDPESPKDRLRRLLKSIPSRRAREILVRRFFLGMTLSEIAQEMGLSLEKTRRLYRAALRRMDRRVQDRPLEPAARPGPEPLPRGPRLDEEGETLAELFWEELHRSGESDRTNYLVQYPAHGKRLAIRLGLIRLFYEERPAHRAGPGFPPEPPNARRDPPEDLTPRRDRICEELARLDDRDEASILCLHLFDGHDLRRIAQSLDLGYRRVRRKYRDGARRLEVRLRDLL